MIGPKVAVSIQSLSESPSSTGALVATWTTIGTIRAVLDEKTEREKFANGKEGFTSDYTLWMSPFSGLTEKHRIQYVDPFLSITRNFKIVALNNAMQKNRIWEIDLLEVQR